MWWQKKLKPIALGLSLLALFLWFEITDVEELANVRQRLELLAYDVRLRLTMDTDVKQDKRITIVDIDEKSLREEGRWPWSRSKMASLLENLHKAGAVVIAIDVIFSEAERNEARQIFEQLRPELSAETGLLTRLEQRLDEFDSDQRFARSLHDKDVVLGYIFHRESIEPVGLLPRPLQLDNKKQILNTTMLSMGSYTANLPVLQKAARYAGFFSIGTDPDGIIRRVPLVIRYKNEIYPSLALETVRLFQLVDKVQIFTERIGSAENITGISLLPGQIIRTDGEGRAIIPFRGPFKSFPYISATDVLNNNYAPGTFENTIVLVGTTAEGLFDLRAVPMQSVYPGVEVHANLIAGMLDNRFPVEPPWARGANFILMLFSGIVVVMVLPMISPLLQIVVTLLISICLLSFNVWLWTVQGYVVAVAIPLLMIFTLAMANLGYGFLFEAKARRFLKHMFGQYVPPELVEVMSDNPSGYGFEGDTREMSVLFADIVGFTTLSEQLSAAEVKRFLNRFFTPMTAVIFKHRGTIDKYVGDMVMAFWGAPLTDPEHALHAVDAALNMITTTEKLKLEFAREGLPNIDICVGINTGMMNVGDMGSEYRRAYTVLGDAVNLASRLEASSRYYGVSLVIGQNTYQAIKGRYLCRTLDLVKVKGKQEPVWVYEPICPLERADTASREEVEAIDAMLECYRSQQWNEALAHIDALITRHGECKLYHIYRDRITFLENNPPGQDWDGSFERRSK